ncbi:uncharacterized protein [Clytia hemisphaerica]|uniref:uncharacterized protein n=1 Tax=Clytia hemisphaerica TaxID=252671 RepID=UPI0034D61020
MKKFGPLYATWMYCLERFNSWITRRTNNKNHMERCVMETYQLFDWVVHCSITNKFPESFDSKNAVCRKTLVKTGEFERITKKRADSTLTNESDLRALNVLLSPKDPIKSATLLKKASELNEYFEDYTINVGSHCQVDEKTCCQIERIVQVNVDGKNVVVLHIKTYNLNIDSETGLYYRLKDAIPIQSGFTLPKFAGEPSVYASEEDKIWLLSMAG